MEVHILGICGTFMGGIARLARASGYTVSGCDRAAYPPMSDQLRELGITITQGFDGPVPDSAAQVIVGNALSRGMPVIEQMLEQKLDFVSGPQWLHDHVLRKRTVIAVAGTHGKTTTSSMLAWILEHAGLNPGFLIGGVPGNFDVSARLGSGPFVVEADEYDTAFFDKRAKLVHYPAEVLVINNIEYDHADIYPDVDAIVRQFHHGLRLLPGSGHLVRAYEDIHIDAAVAQGCWSTVHTVALAHESSGGLAAEPRADGFEVLEGGAIQAVVRWHIPGTYNIRNALAAMQAAALVGVDFSRSAAALSEFVLPARRLERRAVVHGVTLMLDFAHHPTAIRQTLAALRTLCPTRLLAVVEPRSNTMRSGVHGAQLPSAMADADMAWMLTNTDVGGDLQNFGVRTVSNPGDLEAELLANARPGDTIVFMSNGDLSALADRVAARLQR